MYKTNKSRISQFSPLFLIKMVNKTKLHYFSLNNGKWDSFLWEMGLISQNEK